jgi:hypothetical protein
LLAPIAHPLRAGRISDPLQSAVVEVKADLRLVHSKVYATGYTLRFPRIRRVR